MKVTELKQLFHKELDVIYGKDEVDSFFFLCTEFYLDLPRFQLTLQPDLSIVKNEYDIFFTALEDLKLQKPIQYILGETEFYGLKFKVNNNVLIPRPETEELVDWVIKSLDAEALKTVVAEGQKPQIKILDIGTGSGCIAISLAKNLPNAEVYALDVSKEALKIAKQNAELNKVSVTFFEANILNKDSHSAFDANSKFDVIISNPPYVRNLEKQEMQPNVLNNEPHLALFVENKNPLQFYNAIIDFASDRLKLNGRLFFEINQYLGEETKELLDNSNFKNIELKQDINGNARMLRGIKN